MDGAGPESIGLIARRLAALRASDAAAGGKGGAGSALGAAIDRAAARAAEKQFALPVRLMSQSAGRQGGAEVVERLPEHALILLTEGAGGAMGVAILSHDLLSALTEVMTLSRLADRTPPPRRATRTDAMLVAGFLEDVLQGLDGGAESEAPWAMGFRFASHLADPRPLGLMLDEPAYQMVTSRFALGADGRREGELTLVFPDRAAAATAGPAPATDDAAPDWEQHWAEALAPAPLHLHAVLTRISLPLQTLLTLDPGMFLTLPADAPGRVQIEGADGRLIAFAALGQGAGHRAIQLDTDTGAADMPLIAPAPYPAERFDSFDLGRIAAPAPQAHAAERADPAPKTSDSPPLPQRASA